MLLRARFARAMITQRYSVFYTLASLAPIITQPLCNAQPTRPSGLVASAPFLQPTRPSGLVASSSALHSPLRLLLSGCSFLAPLISASYVPHRKSGAPPSIALRSAFVPSSLYKLAFGSGLQASFLLRRSKLAPLRNHSKASLSALSVVAAGYFVPPKPLQGCPLRS